MEEWGTCGTQKKKIKRREIESQWLWLFEFAYLKIIQFSSDQNFLFIGTSTHGLAQNHSIGYEIMPVWRNCTENTPVIPSICSCLTFLNTDDDLQRWKLLHENPRDARLRFPLIEQEIHLRLPVSCPGFASEELSLPVPWANHLYRVTLVSV